jgi:ferric iron reductase protein FhuF
MIDMTSDTRVRLTDLVLPALVTAAQIGPFFSWEPWSPDAGWLPWSSLADGDVLAERVRVARDTLIGMFGLAADDVPVRVVASVTFLGYASRVVSPLLGAAVAGGELPAPRPDELWWRPVPGGPLPVAYGGMQAQPCTRMDVTALAGAVAEVAVAALLTPLAEAFRDRFALSPKVLWGNVASALAGAAGMIADRTAGNAAPAEQAAGVVGAMLRMAPLAGMGTLMQPVPERPRRFLVRNNCCLYYRIPGGGTCGDCVLTPPEERRRGWEAVLRR